MGGSRGARRVIGRRLCAAGRSYRRQTKIIFAISTAMGASFGTSIVWLTWDRRWENCRVRFLVWAFSSGFLCRRVRAVIGEGAVRVRGRRLSVVAIRRANLSLRWERTKRLSMRAVELLALRVHIRTRTTIISKRHISHVGVDSVSRDKGLSLRGDRGENAFLLETLAI